MAAAATVSPRARGAGLDTAALGRTTSDDRGGVQAGGAPTALLLRELHHDLRQPVAAIRALVAAAEVHPDLPDSVQVCLGRIAAEARQILAMCQDVLEREEEPVTLSIGHLVRQVANGCGVTSGCTIELDVEPVMAKVREVELTRAVRNLIENSLRAAGPCGSVIVTVRNLDDAARISVADSGPGFLHGPAGFATLGLGIVDRLVRRQGGQVEVGSGALGGAEVTIVLPAEVLDLRPGGTDVGEYAN